MVTVSGVVKEKWTGEPVSGATISIAGRTTRTGPSGRFSLEVPKGSYGLTASKSGYETVSYSLSATRSLSLEITLKPVVKPL